MNACIGKIPSVLTGLRVEAYRIKYYIEGRFKDITSIVKTHSNFYMCRLLLAQALSISSITLPLFRILTRNLLDYLDSPYPYKKASLSSTPFPLYGLFFELRTLKEYIPLSSEVREELKENPELLDLFEKDDQETLEKQRAYKNDLRPVLLFLKAKSDYNGALNAHNGITINSDNYKGVQELKKKYKMVLIDNITNVDEIKKEIEKITNTIQHVWIFAHGTPTSMLLDGNNEIKSNNIDYLSELMQQKLSKDAHVILYSCSTGKRVLSGENIATNFSKILPGRTIWAPKSPTGVMTFDLGEGFSTKVSFWKSKSRLEFLKEKTRNICCLRPFKKVEVEYNITTQIKDGIELQ